MDYSELELYKDKFIVFECYSEVVEMYQVKTFYYQNIPGLRDYRFSMSQNKCFLYYEQGKVSTMASLVKGNLSVKDMYRILEQVKLTLDGLCDYLLYEENVCFHPSFIRVDQEEAELQIQLLYVPFKENANEKYNDYLIQFVTLISTFYNQKNDMEGFYYFIRLLEDLRKGINDIPFREHLQLFFENKTAKMKI